MQFLQCLHNIGVMHQHTQNINRGIRMLLCCFLCDKNGIDNTLAISTRYDLYNFHVLAEDLMKSGKDPSEYVQENIDLLRNKIIISDDIGGGVVPIDKTDREYREVAGRLNCAVAEYADSVERIFCGISQQIK